MARRPDSPQSDVDLRHTDVGPRRTLACFDRYEDAQELVDRMSDSGLPVDQISIVGRDLTLVEQVTGPLTVWRVGLTGAASTAVLGGLFGVVFGMLFAPTGVSLLTTVLYWVFVGAVFGAIIALIGYALSGGRRDFTSVTGVQADHFEVMASEAAAPEAERFIREGAPRPDVIR